MKRELDVLGVLDDLCTGGSLRGSEYRACCPMPSHLDRRPSFSYNIVKDVFNCKGCHIAGHGLRSLVCMVLGVNKPRAGSYLLPYYIGEHEDVFALQRAVAEANERVKDKQAEAEQAMARRLWDGLYEPEYQGEVTTTWEPPHTEAQEYMLDLRHFTAETMTHFRVHTWEFDKKGHPIYIPLAWQREVWGYTRRAIYDRRDKYLTMVGADTSKYLFGEALAGEAFLLVEGPFDAMKSWQRGARSYGATLSSNFSEAQAAIVAQWARVVICASDQDSAGHDLYCQVVRRMERYHIPVVRMYFSGKDPDEIKPREFKLAWDDAIREAKRVLRTC